MYEKKNANRNPGIEHGQNQAEGMMQRNAASLFHPVREHGITRRCEHGNARQDQILTKGH